MLWYFLYHSVSPYTLEAQIIQMTGVNIMYLGAFMHEYVYIKLEKLALLFLKRYCNIYTNND